MNDKMSEALQHVASKKMSVIALSLMLISGLGDSSSDNSELALWLIATMSSLYVVLQWISDYLAKERKDNENAREYD